MSIDDMFDGGLCPETRLKIQRKQERTGNEVFVSDGRIEKSSLEVPHSYDFLNLYDTSHKNSKSQPQEFLSMALYKI